MKRHAEREMVVKSLLKIYILMYMNSYFLTETKIKLPEFLPFFQGRWCVMDPNFNDACSRFLQVTRRILESTIQYLSEIVAHFISHVNTSITSQYTPKCNDKYVDNMQEKG